MFRTIELFVAFGIWVNTKPVASQRKCVMDFHISLVIILSSFLIHPYKTISH